MQENRLAREESLKRREELIQQLERERFTLRQEKEQQEGSRTSRMQEINAQVCVCVVALTLVCELKMSSIDVFVQQVAQRRKEQWEEQQRQEQEEVEKREELRLQEEELRLETERMNRQGYQQRVSEDSSINEDPVFI